MKRIVDGIFNALLSFGCFMSIYCFHKVLMSTNDGTLIIAAFGASAVLSFSDRMIKISLFQILLCSIIAAFIAIFWNQTDLSTHLKIALAISSIILVMNLINMHYPPAGAIVLIPMISNVEIQNLGYLYVLYPTTTGILIIYSFSIIKNKLNNGKQGDN